mmetsp:Transcript_12798/g.18688  ORF Transcript_12798/g.18688 Transcript_12798/m.18688 type:complete len:118 (-) Transcript_12798:1685-2038(-)
MCIKEFLWTGVPEMVSESFFRKGFIEGCRPERPDNISIWAFTRVPVIEVEISKLLRGLGKGKEKHDLQPKDPTCTTNAGFSTDKMFSIASIKTKFGWHWSQQVIKLRMHSMCFVEAR